MWQIETCPTRLDTWLPNHCKVDDGHLKVILLSSSQTDSKKMKKSKRLLNDVRLHAKKKKNPTVTKGIPWHWSKTFAFQPFCEEQGFDGLSSLFPCTFTDPKNPVKKKNTHTQKKTPQHKVFKNQRNEVTHFPRVQTVSSKCLVSVAEYIQLSQMIQAVKCSPQDFPQSQNLNYR